jgi:hypothetical protein
MLPSTIKHLLICSSIFDRKIHHLPSNLSKFSLHSRKWNHSFPSILPQSLSDVILICNCLSIPLEVVSGNPTFEIYSNHYTEMLLVHPVAYDNVFLYPMDDVSDLINILPKLESIFCFNPSL